MTGGSVNISHSVSNIGVSLVTLIIGDDTIEFPYSVDPFSCIAYNLNDPALIKSTSYTLIELVFLITATCLFTIFLRVKLIGEMIFKLVTLTVNFIGLSLL